MIRPEPNWACDLSGLQPGEAGVNMPLPAAGRLGVIEEKCINTHSTAMLVLGMPCRDCGARE